MNKLLTTVGILLFGLVVVGCGESGSSNPTAAAVTPTQVANTPTEEPATPTPAPSPTQVILATPTPKPAPATPTSMPPSPSPETQAEAAEPAKPAVTEVMLEIAAGSFTMGSDSGDPEDDPAHEVDLPAFEIDKFEVTNADYAVFADETAYETFAEKGGYKSWRDEWADGEDNHPVVRVTWADANAYCGWLGKRLPGEAEWEKAARGEDQRAFPWGSDWDPAKANDKESGLRGTTAAGSFGAGASPYGVEDMAGNVWEWTADWYQAYPNNATQDQYYGETFRVTRGGGWFDEEAQLTTFNRNAADPQKTANNDLGFRCAR